MAFAANRPELKAPARRGLGIAFLPAMLVATPRALGELAPVLPKTLGLEGSASLVDAAPSS
jgi:hypothetical protein